MSGFWLRVRTRSPRDFRVYDGAIVGRLPDCAVYLPHKSVSRRHAVLRIVGDLVHVEDQGSSNGTFVNGQPVDHGTLIAGDELRIGAVPLVLIHEPAASEDTQRRAPVPRAADFAMTQLAEDADAEDRFALDDELEELTLAGFDEEASAGARPPAAAEEPRVAPRRAASPDPAPSSPETRHEGRVLQYRKRPDGGFLATDLSQWSGLQRLLAVLGVLALAAALFLGVAQLTGSL